MEAINLIIYGRLEKSNKERTRILKKCGNAISSATRGDNTAVEHLTDGKAVLLTFKEAWYPQDGMFCIPSFAHLVNAPNMKAKESGRFSCRNFYYNISHLVTKAKYSRIGKIFEFGGVKVKMNERLKNKTLEGKRIYVVPMSECEFIWFPEDVYEYLNDLEDGSESSSSSDDSGSDYSSNNEKSYVFELESEEELSLSKESRKREYVDSHREQWRAEYFDELDHFVESWLQKRQKLKK